MDVSQLPQDQFIHIDFINTRYCTIGDNETPLILVHGLGGYAENWMYNVSVLAKHFKIYVLDLVGFGKSDKAEAPYTYDYFAKFVHDFMEKMHIEKAHLIGHSLGGGIVLQFALKYPEKVKKLVIVASSGLGKKASMIHRITSLPIIGKWITKPSRKGISRLYESMVYNKEVITEEMVELGYQMFALPGAQKVYLSTTRAAINFFGQKQKAINPIRRNLQLIDSPVMVIWGQQDKILPLSHAYIAKKQIKNVTTHLFDQCGHVPMVEHPEEFNIAVDQFLFS